MNRQRPDLYLGGIQDQRKNPEEVLSLKGYAGITEGKGKAE